MDVSVSSMINMSMDMQSTAVTQDIGAIMLRKTLNVAAQQIATLMQAAMPQLATSGTLGTVVNTYA
ncbi:MAG TPA: putative motility protein [Bordetella sp.]